MSQEENMPSVNGFPENNAVDSDSDVSDKHLHDHVEDKHSNDHVKDKRSPDHDRGLWICGCDDHRVSGNVQCV